MTFSPGLLNIVVYQGDYFEKEFTFSQGTPAVAVNLAGYTVAAKIRLHPTDTSAVLTFTGTVSDAANGKFKITADVATTAALVLTTIETIAFWDCELTPPNGRTFKVVRGTAKLIAEATK